MTPGDEEQWTISVQHTEAEVQTYIDAFDEFCRELAS
jgi:glutamate-1-semialdehyde 2,1-aminomutase